MIKDDELVRQLRDAAGPTTPPSGGREAILRLVKARRRRKIVTASVGALLAASAIGYVGVDQFQAADSPIVANPSAPQPSTGVPSAVKPPNGTFPPHFRQKLKRIGAQLGPGNGEPTISLKQAQSVAIKVAELSPRDQHGAAGMLRTVKKKPDCREQLMWILSYPHVLRPTYTHAGPIHYERLGMVYFINADSGKFLQAADLFKFIKPCRPL